MNIIFLFLCLFFSQAVLSSPGQFHLFQKQMQGSELALPRDIYVYLPPDYNKSSGAKYPVLYMHDGQNLFDPQRAYLGQTWNAQETLNRLILNKVITPIIVVAIDNTSHRLHEYTHDFDADRRQGGGGEAYLRFVARELKPLIDKNFPTLTQRRHTGMMGSSLGGLISIYAAGRYPATFGLVGAMSPSIWWNRQSILGVQDRSSPLPFKVYLDMGTEGGEMPDDARAIGDIYLRQGLNKNLLLNIQSGAYHTEKFWAQRLPVALRFLFPAK